MIEDFDERIFKLENEILKMKDLLKNFELGIEYETALTDVRSELSRFLGVTRPTIIKQKMIELLENCERTTEEIARCIEKKDEEGIRKNINSLRNRVIEMKQEIQKPWHAALSLRDVSRLVPHALNQLLKIVSDPREGVEIIADNARIWGIIGLVFVVLGSVGSFQILYVFFGIRIPPLLLLCFSILFWIGLPILILVFICGFVIGRAKEKWKGD